MRSMTRIMLLAAWTVLVFGAGKYFGLQEKSSTAVSRVEECIRESIRTGQPFVFHGGSVGLIIKEQRSGNKRLIAYRAIAFIWPEDQDVHEIPINKFGQYGKEWRRTWQTGMRGPGSRVQ